MTTKLLQGYVEQTTNEKALLSAINSYYSKTWTLQLHRQWIHSWTQSQRDKIGTQTLVLVVNIRIQESTIKNKFSSGSTPRATSTKKNYSVAVPQNKNISQG